MITSFKEQTNPLNEYERKTLLPLIISGLRTKIGANNVIAGSVIVSKMRSLGYKLDGPRLRKIINYIRNTGIIPRLVSNSNGYYIATKRQELDDFIKSLQERADAILAVKCALERQRNTLTD